jgi:predicted PurR-regulated permease PerM
MFGLVLLTYILFSLQGILAPLMFALIIAILLNPLVNSLRKRKLPHVVSIIIAMLLSTVVIWIFFYILSDQLASFSDQLPVLRQKLSAMLLQLQQWVQQTFSIAISKQVQLINELLNSSKGMVGQTLNTVLGAVSVLVLIPVYIFLFLFYKQLMLDFLYDVLTTTDSKQVADILGESKTAVQSYMVGLLLEALIIAVLNSVALLLLGVEYAILLGVIGALMNILPYIGGIIAIALPVLMSTVTTEGFSTQVGIVIAYLIIQMIDNNFIVPLIVSSKVKINALFSIVAVLLGGALWGISGMFLSIPVTGILKIMFDRIDGLQPWGKLLGYQESVKMKSISLKRKNRKEQGAQ